MSGMPRYGDTTIVIFDDAKLDEIVSLSVDERKQYTSAPFITIYHRLTEDDTYTLAGEYVPESLACALWPGLRIIEDNFHGRTAHWRFDANTQGFDVLFTWLKRSVADGKYWEMSDKISNTEDMFLKVRDAARAVRVEALVRIAEVGVSRVRAGEQLAAAQTVQQ